MGAKKMQIGRCIDRHFFGFVLFLRVNIFKAVQNALTPKAPNSYSKSLSPVLT